MGDWYAAQYADALTLDEGLAAQRWHGPWPTRQEGPLEERARREQIRAYFADLDKRLTREATR